MNTFLHHVILEKCCGTQISGTVIIFLPDKTTYLYTNMSAQANVPANVMNPNDKLVPFATKMMEKVGSRDYVWFCEQAFTEAGDLAQIVTELNTKKTDPNLEWFCLYAQDLFDSAVRLADMLKVREEVTTCQAAAKRSIDDARAFVDNLPVSVAAPAAPSIGPPPPFSSDSDSDSDDETSADRPMADVEGAAANVNGMAEDAGHKRKTSPDADTPSTAKKLKPSAEGDGKN